MKGCAKAAAGFGAPLLSAEARIGGNAVPRAAAVREAARLLREARLPLISGLAVDLDGIRALLSLADRAGAVIDPWQSRRTQVNLEVMRRSGTITTTLGEIANRADLVALLGRDPSTDYPRFFERFIDNRGGMYRKNRPMVVFLGEKRLAPPAHLVDEIIDQPSPQALFDSLGVIAAMLGGEAPPAVPKPLTSLITRFEEAKYGVLLWEAAALAPPAPAIERILRIVEHLNRKTRCVGFALGGSGNATGVAQAMLWQAGWPGQVNFADGAPRHDPIRYDSEALVASGETDLLLWAMSLRPTPPPASQIPTIALLPPDAPLDIGAAVEFRVGVPGLDHGGTLHRADPVVALPLKATRPARAPNLASLIAEITRAIEEDRP